MSNYKRHLVGNVSRRGISLVEVVCATMIVGFVLVGAMDLLGAVVSGRTTIVSAARGEQFAQQLMAEILACDYQDASSPVFGPESDETSGRSVYDDVDDYHNWSQTTVTAVDGDAMVNVSGWQRSAVVVWVDPANPGNTSLTDQGVKRITVSVSYGGQVVSRLVGLRSNKY